MASAWQNSLSTCQSSKWTSSTKVPYAHNLSFSSISPPRVTFFKRFASHGIKCCVRNPKNIRTELSSDNSSCEVYESSQKNGGKDGLNGGFSNGRREMMTAIVAVLVGGNFVEPVEAFELGFSGPREWLKEQKKRTAFNLYKPIIASRSELDKVALLIETNGVQSDILEEAVGMVKIAARDCLPPDKGSLIAFQTSTGIEVCTFKLILKNAASLLKDDDETKISAEETFSDLVKSFGKLTGELEKQNDMETGDSVKLVNEVRKTQKALDRFQNGVKSVLGIPV